MKDDIKLTDTQKKYRQQMMILSDEYNLKHKDDEMYNESIRYRKERKSKVIISFVIVIIIAGFLFYKYKPFELNLNTNIREDLFYYCKNNSDDTIIKIINHINNNEDWSVIKNLAIVEKEPIALIIDNCTVNKTNKRLSSLNEKNIDYLKNMLELCNIIQNSDCIDNDIINHINRTQFSRKLYIDEMIKYFDKYHIEYSISEDYITYSIEKIVYKNALFSTY